MPDPIFPPPPRVQPGIPVSVVLLLGALLAIGAGFAAVFIQAHFSPVGLFPLMLGALTGLATGVLWNGHVRKTKGKVLLSALTAGLICLATLHYGSYFLASLTRDKSKIEVPAQVALIDPDAASRLNGAQSFPDYIAKEWRRGRTLGSLQVTGAWLALWYALDALAIMGAAMYAATFSAGTAATERNQDEERQQDSGATQ